MPAPRPILIVDDDAALRATLAEQLALDGEFAPAEAETAAEAEQMLTGPDARYDAVLLDIGLPDGELLARMRAQLRVFGNSEDAVFTIGPYMFQPSARLLIEGARTYKIRLTEKESAILKYLCRARGRPVPRQVLLNEVWGYNSAVTTHTLQTHIYRLRQKIEPDPSNARLLLTEGSGYRLDPTMSDTAAD